MNAWGYLAIHDAAAIGSGAYLVIHDHPWWAALCFLLAASTTVNTRSETSKKLEKESA